MSWSIERSDPRPGGEQSLPDIVFRGFENGVADGATNGIQDMRGVNIISNPGQMQVNFGTSSITIPSTVTAAAVTLNADDTVTFSGGLTLYNGMAVKFGSTAGGVTADRIYWISNLTATTFKVYDHISRAGTAVNLTDAANTLTTITLAKPKWGCADYEARANTSQSGFLFFQDASGQVWWINDSGNLIYIGPLITGTGLAMTTTATGNGIIVNKEFLYAFRETKIDYLPISALTNNTSTTSQWGNDWQTVTAPVSGTVIHQAITGRDNAIYFCNNQFVGSIIAASGTNIDPTNAASYTYTPLALQLPGIDMATYIAELGNTLLIGGKINSLYTWDRINPGINTILILAENYTSRIVSTNANAYLFIGNRGRIYITNGSNVELYKKIPDSLTNEIDPYYTWGDAMYWRNQLFFGVNASENDGTNISTFGNVWAIDVTTNALRHTNYTSGGGYAEDNQALVLLPNIRSSSPAGTGFYIGWYSTLFGAAQGVDITTTAPYTSTAQTYIITDLVPVGNFFTGRTFQQIEYKLTRPLVANESIVMYWRKNLTDSFTQLTSTSTQVGAMSGTFGNTIDPSQYIQLKAGLASTATTPSYCPLTEIRLR